MSVNEYIGAVVIVLGAATTEARALIAKKGAGEEFWHVLRKARKAHAVLKNALDVSGPAVNAQTRRYVDEMGAALKQLEMLAARTRFAH